MVQTVSHDDLIEAWRVNNRVNHEILSWCADEDLDLKPGKGKTIRSNFVHIISVRRMHLEEKVSKLAAEIPRLDWQAATREEIRAALDQTSSMMEVVFAKIAESTRKTRWTATLLFGYSIAHEAHHRSQIEIALRLAGRGPSEELSTYKLWDWPKMVSGES